LPNQRLLYPRQPAPMIFGKYYPTSPVIQRLKRRSGNVQDHELVQLGRRRSLSLDDLGKQKTKRAELEKCRTSDKPVNVDTDDEDLEDLPSQGEEVLLVEDFPTLLDESNSLSTIREASPINSTTEEWSPSPPVAAAEDDIYNLSSSTSTLDNNRKSLLPAEDRTRSHPKGFVNNCLSKMKHIMKK
jgi:hypothetical protein